MSSIHQGSIAGTSGLLAGVRRGTPDRAISRGRLGPDLFPRASWVVDNPGGNSYTYNEETRTLTTSTTGTLSSYPRLRFLPGLEAGRLYEVKGQISGDLALIQFVRLATAGEDNYVDYDETTGAISGVVAAAADALEFLVDGQSATGTFTIDHLSVREIQPRLGYELWDNASAYGMGGTAILQPDGSFNVTATSDGVVGIRMNVAGRPFGLGRYYEIEGTWSGNDQGRNLYFFAGKSAPVIGNQPQGRKSQMVDTTDAFSQSIQMYANNALTGDTFNFRIISVQEVLPEYGPELIKNGSFSTGTTAGWTASSAAISIEGGRLRVQPTTGGSNAAMQGLTGLTVGDIYEVASIAEADAANSVARSARVLIAGVDSEVVPANGTASELRYRFKATATYHQIRLEVASGTVWGEAGDVAYFDNVSVRKVIL